MPKEGVSRDVVVIHTATQQKHCEGVAVIEFVFCDLNELQHVIDELSIGECLETFHGKISHFGVCKV